MKKIKDGKAQELFERDTKLADYMQEHFDFSSMKKMGIFPKEMKKNDYEGQAERICYHFGYDEVYEYTRTEIRCHLSMVIPKGVHSIAPFVTVLNPAITPLQKEEAKIIKLPQ
jgi:hypothetical protein